MRGLGLLLASLLGPWAGTAWAQVPATPGRVPCYSHTEVARQLQGSYAEAPVSLGVQSNDNLLQVFASATTGSWTIVSITPDGVACVLAVGNNWESMAPARHDPSA